MRADAFTRSRVAVLRCEVAVTTTSSWLPVSVKGSLITTQVSVTTSFVAISCVSRPSPVTAAVTSFSFPSRYWTVHPCPPPVPVTAMSSVVVPLFTSRSAKVVVAPGFVCAGASVCAGVTLASIVPSPVQSAPPCSFTIRSGASCQRSRT
ncbi:MAG: hypothetical protein BWY76_00650 [bacterium ADurb.Bin429]|nr:MAG: hypothetical protein BWY76_00650 [bacterium ADurb.Bin429]